MNKLKEEFKDMWLKKKFTDDELETCWQPIWRWINQNYISKEEVEGLKINCIEHVYRKKNGAWVEPDAYNEVVDETNQKITNLLNK